MDLALPLGALLGIVELAHSDLASNLLTQTTATAEIQVRRELQPRSTLYGLYGDLKVSQALIVRNAGIGQHEGTQGNLAGGRVGVILGVDNLVEVGGNSNVRRVTNNLIVNAPLSIGVLVGEIQRTSNDANRRILLREVTAESLEVRPVIAVEALANLGAHVAQRKSVVHSLLRPFRVCSRNLVASVIAGAEVVCQLGAEHSRDVRILGECAVLAVGIVQCQGRGRDVFGDPGGVARATVEGAVQNEVGDLVGDWAWEAILHDSGGVDGTKGCFRGQCWRRDC